MSLFIPICFHKLVASGDILYSYLLRQDIGMYDERKLASYTFISMIPLRIFEWHVNWNNIAR